MVKGGAEINCEYNSKNACQIENNILPLHRDTELVSQI